MKKLILIMVLLLTATTSPILKADPSSKVIATVVERSSTIFVYNDKGTIITTLTRGSGPKDGLQGYTQSTISVRRSGTIYVYNPNGTIINTITAGN